jgi:putative PIN family toxin of toxin-antitoxin system
MASHIRAVLDTNVILAAHRTKHPASPNAEILARWRRREFQFLYSLDTLAEYAEKLLEHGISAIEIEEFIRLLARHGETVPIVFFHFRHYPVDPDDVMFLLCAINGSASHLVSYDDHLLSLQPYYSGELAICEPVKFLAAFRTA